jgi:hypothetical protein
VQPSTLFSKKQTKGTKFGKKLFNSSLTFVLFVAFVVNDFPSFAPFACFARNNLAPFLHFSFLHSLQDPIGPKRQVSDPPPS